jgi:acetyltransferase
MQLAERRMQTARLGLSALRADPLQARSGLRPPPRRTALVRAPHAGSDAVETLGAKDGTALILRSIRADDVAALQRFFGRLTPAEVRMRFLHPLAELPEPFARQLCELDPAVAVAWVLADPDDSSHLDISPEISGVARTHVDPVLEQAEYGIVIQGRFARQGLGTLLMRRIIDSARKLGAREMWSDVLIENTPMLALCRSLGFTRNTMPHSPGLVRVSLAL